MQKYISSCYTLNYTIYKHFTSIQLQTNANFIQLLQRKRPTNYTIANYTIVVKHNFLQLYTTDILCFCFCIKREKHISFCYTLIIIQYTYILIRFNYMQNKLYNCCEIGQRIIQFRPANYTIVYVQQIIQFYVCYGAQLCKVCYSIQI